MSLSLSWVSKEAWERSNDPILFFSVCPALLKSVIFGGADLAISRLRNPRLTEYSFII